MTQKPTTLDQVVAFNLRRARQLRKWTQSQAAERLEPYLGERWSSAVFSAAERSFEGARVREFTASNVLAFARGFDLPITWFYLPPELDTEVTSRGSDEVLSGHGLLWLLVPETHPDQARMARAAAFQARMTELAGGESLEVIQRSDIPLLFGMTDYKAVSDSVTRHAAQVDEQFRRIEPLFEQFRPLLELAEKQPDGAFKSAWKAMADAFEQLNDADKTPQNSSMKPIDSPTQPEETLE